MNPGLSGQKHGIDHADRHVNRLVLQQLRSPEGHRADHGQRAWHPFTPDIPDGHAVLVWTHRKGIVRIPAHMLRRRSIEDDIDRRPQVRLEGESLQLNPLGDAELSLQIFVVGLLLQRPADGFGPGAASIGKQPVEILGDRADLKQCRPQPCEAAQ